MLTLIRHETGTDVGCVYLKLILQSFSQSAELVQTFPQVNVTVELDEGFDEVRHAPLRFDFVPAAQNVGRY